MGSRGRRARYRSVGRGMAVCDLYPMYHKDKRVETSDKYAAAGTDAMGEGSPELRRGASRMHHVIHL